MSEAGRSSTTAALAGFWVRKIALTWVLCGLVIFLIQVIISGIIHDNERFQMMIKMMDMMPSLFSAMIGEEEFGGITVSSMLAFGYEHPLVLIMYMVFAVGVPTGLLTGEVQGGMMELLLSRAVTKRKAYLVAGALTVAGMIGLTQVMFLGTVVGTRLFSFEREIALWPFWMLSINGCLLASAVGGVALLAAATFKRRGTAVGATVAFLVVNHLVDLMGTWWPVMKPVRPMSLFHYVDNQAIVSGAAWQVGDMAVLVVVLAVAAVAGAVVWEKRDLPL